jgi:hypothetical protein
VVGGRLRACGVQMHECKYRRQVKKGEMVRVTNKMWAEDEDSYLDNSNMASGDIWSYCLANDRNCICDGKLYIVEKVR